MTYVSRTDDEALAALERLARTEGILCALETAHAIAALDEVARMSARTTIVVGLSGRGDKDMVDRARSAPEGVDDRAAARRVRSRGRRAARRARRVPDVRRSAIRQTSIAIVEAACRAGADVIELGVPFSDPSADGPSIQRAMERALAAGGRLAGALDAVAAAAPRAASRRRSCCSATTTRSS